MCRVWGLEVEAYLLLSDMEATHYLGIVVLVGVLGVPLLCMPVCNSVFKQKSGAILSSGKRIAADEVKTPLAASVAVRQRSRNITFSFRLKDADGVSIGSLRPPSGQPKPPRVKIFDDQGKQVYACTLEYG